jgi:hypothetical protein
LATTALVAGAVFFAAGFFAVAISFSLINLQRALNTNYCVSNDAWCWVGSQHHELGSATPCHERWGQGFAK